MLAALKRAYDQNQAMARRHRRARDEARRKKNAPKSSSSSSYLMMTPIGGAVGPLMMGYVGDMTSMSFSFVIPLISYFVVLLYALKVVRIRS